MRHITRRSVLAAAPSVLAFAALPARAAKQAGLVLWHDRQGRDCLFQDAERPGRGERAQDHFSVL